MSDKFIKTIMVDFDGVIHQATSPWTGQGIIPDPPFTHAIDWLTKLCKNFHVVIYSCRCNEREGQLAILAWLKKHGLPSGAIKNLGLEGKPMAHVYIDDRNMCFRGQYPSVGEIAEW